MKILAFFVVPLFLLLVVSCLGLGLFSLARGGDPHYSNRMMRWRVIAQGAALAFMCLFLWLAGNA